MIRIIAYALAAVVAALATATISERFFSFDTAESVLLFGIVMGVINSFIKPIVSFLSLPISCLTFGLFAVVINAGLFALGAWLVPGVEVSWFGAVIGSIIASIAGGIMFSVLDE
ncbi:MAG TPA: phage holin family protein [Thermomicrobiales bacterium]|jgi:putative membrane protein|nr:phage holin family protein [Thermomicrobiales bacterium]